MASVKIGLEVHGYLNMESGAKLFCDCGTGEAEPNSNVCPICTGMPGSKPMAPNREAVDKIIAIAGMLGCRINERLLLQRKHYDWPDMPTGYQRTISGSYSVPVGEEGSFMGIGISDVHLEEDPARWDPETGLVDYNRAGLPLVEAVTDPDFSSAAEVREWLKRLVTMLSYIRAIDPKAGMKSDVNVSIGPDFKRVEIKNVNSFRSIIRAIESEVRRQEKERKEGREIPVQTRAWDESSGSTVFMREKESSADYMYVPEPDLPAVHVAGEWADRIVSELPERPAQKIERYMQKLKIDRVDAEVLSSDVRLAELFEKVSKEIDPVLAGRWFRKELLRVTNYAKKDVSQLEMDERHMVQLLKLVGSGKITDEVARKILEKLVEEPFDVEEYVRESNLAAVSDVSALEWYAREAVAENGKAVDDYKSGNGKALNFIMGSVMRKSGGRASPKEVMDLLKKIIG